MYINQAKLHIYTSKLYSKLKLWSQFGQQPVKTQYDLDRHILRKIGNSKNANISYIDPQVKISIGPIINCQFVISAIYVYKLV